MATAAHRMSRWSSRQRQTLKPAVCRKAIGSCAENKHSCNARGTSRSRRASCRGEGFPRGVESSGHDRRAAAVSNGAVFRGQERSLSETDRRTVARKCSHRGAEQARAPRNGAGKLRSTTAAGAIPTATAGLFAGTRCCRLLRTGGAFGQTRCKLIPLDQWDIGYARNVCRDGLEYRLGCSNMASCRWAPGGGRVPRSRARLGGCSRADRRERGACCGRAQFAGSVTNPERTSRGIECISRRRTRGSGSGNPDRS